MYTIQYMYMYNVYVYVYQYISNMCSVSVTEQSVCYNNMNQRNNYM